MYDHTHWNTRDPVRSPIVKSVRAGSVAESVTISEYPVLYVFACFGFGPTGPGPLDDSGQSGGALNWFMTTISLGYTCSN